MPNLHANPSPTRIPAPIPGVPESQAKALDRRLRLHRQMQSFRRPQRTEPAHPVRMAIDPAGPARA